jgi:hypothetical protein
MDKALENMVCRTRQEQFGEPNQFSTRQWIIIVGQSHEIKGVIGNKLVLHLHRDNQWQQIFTHNNENKAIQIQDY